MLEEENNHGYEYDYHRTGSGEDEMEEILRSNGGDGDDEEEIPLDWKSTDQREELKIWWSMAWPTMVIFFSTQSYGLIDMAFLGHFGKESSNYLAAASQSSMVFDITFAIFTRGFLQVLIILCSQAYGAEKFSLLGEWLQVCLLIVCIFGVPIAILFWFTNDILQYCFDLDEKIADLVKTFSRLSILRLYPQLIVYSIRQFCLAQKIIKPLVVIAIVGLLLNIFLNQIFIHGLFGWSGLGFEGSPIATATTNATICICTIIYVFYIRKDTGKTWKGFSRKAFSPSHLKEFMLQGIPLSIATCLEDFQMQAVNMFAIHISHTFPGDSGSWVLASHSGLLTFLGSILAFQWGVMKATSVRCAHYIGGQSAVRAKLVMKMAFVVSTLVSFASATFLILARYQIGHVFSNDTKVINQTAELIPPLACGYCLLSLFYIGMATIDAQGRPQVVMVSFLFGAWMVAVPLSYVLGIVYDFKLMGLWIGLIVGYFVTTVVLCIFVFTTDWKNVLQEARRRNEIGVSQTPSFDIIGPDANILPSPVFGTSPSIS